jgi:hypothetical protein
MDKNVDDPCISTLWLKNDPLRNLADYAPSFQLVRATAYDLRATPLFHHYSKNKY